MGTPPQHTFRHCSRFIVLVVAPFVTFVLEVIQELPQSRSFRYLAVDVAHVASPSGVCVNSGSGLGITGLGLWPTYSCEAATRSKA